MGRGWQLALGGLAVAAAGIGLERSPGAAAVEPFEEVIDVVEVALLVDLPRRAPLRGLEPDPGEVLVVEEGRVREVAGLERVLDPADDVGPWHVVVYVDRPLCRPQTLEETALALAHRAAELIRLGSVAIAAHGEPPRELLAPTPHLLRLEAEGCDDGPCLLLLISDGAPPAGVAEAEGAAEAAGIVATASRDLEEALAGTVWAVTALPLVAAGRLAGGPPTDAPPGLRGPPDLVERPEAQRVAVVVAEVATGRFRAQRLEPPRRPERLSGG